MLTKTYKFILSKGFSSSVAISIVAVSAAVMIVINSFDLLDSYKNDSHLLVKLESNSNDIKYYDEVLTMSARMSAFTSEKKWEKRYNDAVIKLDDAIQQVTTSYPNGNNKIKNIDNANQKLILMERKTFEYVTLSQQDEAIKLITSNQYNLQKELYSKGLSDLLAGIDQFSKQLEDKHYKHLILGLGSNFVLFTLVLLALVKSINSVAKHKELTAKNVNLQELMVDSQISSTLTELVGVISATIDMRDPYTAGHQRRVSDLAVAIGKKMNLPESKLIAIKLAGLIHDLGKMHVPIDILIKPTKLSEGEISILREHPAFGYEVLKAIKTPWPLADIVHQHHEHCDGSGYPNHIKKDQILIEARIIAVADLVEAMNSMRPYREALGIDVALKELTRNAGTKYDPDVVAACVSLFKSDEFNWT